MSSQSPVIFGLRRDIIMSATLGGEDAVSITEDEMGNTRTESIE
jgi:hypothetical protein